MAEVVEAEIAFQFVLRVVCAAAIAAGGVVAGLVAQRGEQLPDFWKLVAYPGCQYRITAGHA